MRPVLHLFCFVGHRLYIYIYIYIYIYALARAGRRVSRPRGTGSVGDSVGEGADARVVGATAPVASYLQLFFYIVVIKLGAEVKGATRKRVRQPRVLPALAN